MADNKNLNESAAWEVVSVTDSMHAAAGAIDDETKGKELLSGTMFDSGHFSLSQRTDLESIFMASDSKSAVVQDESESRRLAMDSSGASERNKIKDELDVDFIEPTVYACTGYDVSQRIEEDNSVCDGEKGIEERGEFGGEEEGGKNSSWFKKLGLICQKVSEDKMLCLYVATAALVGVAILSRRWQREKPRFGLGREGINFTVAGPMKRIKVLLTNNQQFPLTHSESSSFSQ